MGKILYQTRKADKMAYANFLSHPAVVYQVVRVIWLISAVGTMAKFLYNEFSVRSVIIGLITCAVGYFVFNIIANLAAIPILRCIGWVVGAIFGYTRATTQQNSFDYEREKTNKENCFCALGITTGTLNNKGVPDTPIAGQSVIFDLESACTNFVCFGGIGSGKTTRVMLPLTCSIFNNEKDLPVGGLIFDVKGDFAKDLYPLIATKAKNIITIGVTEGCKGFDLLKGLSPELASSYLNSVLLLSGHSSDPFWVDTATELFKNSLAVLQYVPNKYNLNALYQFIFDEEKKEKWIAEAAKNLPESDREMRIFEGAKMYLEKVFGTFDEKVQKSVMATCAQVLSPFQHPDLTDAFCPASDDNVANIYDVLKAKLFIVKLPLATWGLGAKVVYTMIKLRFFSVVQERLVNDSLDKQQPVVFICDEYQDLISANKAGMSDLTFWDKSRSAKCIGIISSQSISSFKSAVGDEKLADTILQNFRQKICFRTEDVATIEYFQRVYGEVEVERTSISSGSSTGTSSSGMHSSNNSGSSSGTTTSTVMRKVIDPLLINSLDTDFGLVLANISGYRFLDIVQFYRSFEIISVTDEEKNNIAKKVESGELAK